MSTASADLALPREPAADRVPARTRLDSVDLVRGAVMVLMALDHARDYFSDSRIDMANVGEMLKAPPALFLTRWVTHFCAPVFVFLAGTGAYLGGLRGKSRRELSWFLLTRGVWLVVLELTVVHFAWTFNVRFQDAFVQVIWAIGASMIVLAGLVFLPTWIVTAFGVGMIATHDLFDRVSPEAFGKAGWVWGVLHVFGPEQPARGWNVFVAYPLVPWVGVMAAGYGLGALYTLEPARRAALLRALGAGLITAFVVLRATNLYGDPHPWSPQPRGAVMTVLAFVDCEKYPPSLLYLLMTLGPAILALSFLERNADSGRRGLGRVLVVYGRVPLFFYVLHIFLIHFAAAVYAAAKYGRAALSFGPFNLPADYGFPLPVVYLVWLFAVAALYPACVWFAGVKSRRRDAWLSYL
jgi:uncharacterized membrane protein